MSESKKPRRAPKPVAAANRSEAQSIGEGARVVRRPIYQARYGQEGGWGRELVDHIVVAKSLGFTLFEIDVTPIQSSGSRKQKVSDFYGLSTLWAIAAPVEEGEEWKGDAKKSDLRKDFVITIYAVVVE